VKPIHLNLASRPYRDYTRVNVVAASMFVAMLVLAWFNFDTWLRYNVETENTRARIAELETAHRREKELEQSAQTRLQSVDLAFLDEQTKFVNAKLLERAFSWSALLDELESVIANDVRLLTVTPSFAQDGTINLSLAFEAKTGNGMITTINRMHGDPQFVNPFPSNETVSPEGVYSFNLTVGYRPAPAATHVPAKAQVTR
jgi:type IV pilus assembly protein PilN